MKRLLPLVFACAWVVSAYSCHHPTSSQDNSSSNAPSGTGTVSANVGGANFSASGTGNVTAARETSGANFSISANSGGAIVALVMSGPTAPGTYNLGPGGVGAGRYTAGGSEWQSSIGAGTGTVTFTVLTAAHATGTFSFNGAAVLGTSATGTKSVTSGVFDVSFGQ